MVLDVRARQGVDRVVAPIGRALSRVGITPSMVTIAGLAVTIVGAVFIGRGQLLAGAIIATAGSLLDIVDGPLARTTGTASRRGALLDTLADRLGEVAIWIGLVHFLGGETRLLTLAVAGLAASMLVPYIRSKAEGWGAEGKGGLMGRAERLIVILAGIGLQGFEFGSFRPLEASLWILAVATWLTVAQRSWRTWSQLAE